MGREGWIKGWRKTLDNPVVMKSPEHFMVWHYLLYNAEPRPKQSLFGGKPITLEAGQLTTGRKQIATSCGISESKVERVLKDLELAEQVEQQKSTKNRLISIVSWHEYQASEQRANNGFAKNSKNSKNSVQKVNNKRTAESIDNTGLAASAAFKSEQQTNNKRTTSEQRANTLEEDKKIRREEIGGVATSSWPPAPGTPEYDAWRNQ